MSLKKLSLFLLLIGSIIVSGCGHITEHYDVSIPIENKKLKLEQYKPLVEAKYNFLLFPETPHVKLSIKPFNARPNSAWAYLLVPIPIAPSKRIAAPFKSGKKVPGSPFIVEITIFTEIEGVRFHPNKVSLIMKDGSRISPTGWASSGSKEIVPVLYPYQSQLNLCHQKFSGKRPSLKLDQKLVNQFDASIRVHPARNHTDFMCFWLVFDVSPPTPEESFFILIKGLEKNGLSLSIPKISFDKGSGKYFESWL